MNNDLLFVLVGSVLIVGFYFGLGVRKLRFPSLVGYMILGVLVGPSVFGAFTDQALDRLSFITEMSLGFVAFSIGAELSMSSLRRQGKGIVSIIFAESLGAFLVTAGFVYLLTFITTGTGDAPLALVFGAMAPASAPAGTVAVIQEYRAKGTLTKALYAVVGFDDGLAIIIFGFALAIARMLLSGGASGGGPSFLVSMGAPALEIILSLVTGGVLGLLFCQAVRRLRHPRDMLIMIFGFVFVATGISILLNLSLILTCLVIGFVLANTRREELVAKVTAPLLDVMPLFFIVFFCLAGAHLDISKLPTLGLLGVTYIVARSAGLIGGARLGALFGHVEPKIKKYIGLGILSQAGVAIGLSLIVNHEFSKLGPEAAEIGAKVLTTITATCIVFEIVGPVLTKFALGRAGELGRKED